MNKIIILVCFVSTLLAGAYSATIDFNVDGLKPPTINLPPLPDVVLVPPPPPPAINLAVPNWLPLPTVTMDVPTIGINGYFATFRRFVNNLLGVVPGITISL